MSIENLNLIELQKFESLIPELAGFASRLLVKTYDDFIRVLYQDIDEVISLIQENLETRVKDSEDRLTIEIIGLLRRSGYNATHDAKIGGHAGIVIRKKDFI